MTGDAVTHPTDLLPDYLLGELGFEEVRALEAHLATCEACREELDRLSGPVVALTEALPQARPPEALWQGLQARFSEEIERRKRQAALPEVLALPRRAPAPSSRVWLLAACIAVVVAGSSLFWGYQNYGAYQQAQVETQLLASYLAQPEVQKVALENVIGSGRSAALGSALLAPDNEVLFVLASAAPAGSVYQAWGHSSSDWDPDRGEELTSLTLSESGVFEVDASGFASLYLSLEPGGGSPQPTDPLSKVSLLTPRSALPIEITSPQPGTILATDSVIVSGVATGETSSLRYRVNGGRATAISFSNNRFSFTAVGLKAGENTVELEAIGAAGEVATDTVTLRYTPPEQ